MFGFSLLLLTKISKSKLCLKSLHTDLAQQRAWLNCVYSLLSLPCSAVLAAGVTQRLPFRKAAWQRCPRLRLNAHSRALYSMGAGLFLLVMPLVLSHPLQLLCMGCLLLVIKNEPPHYFTLSTAQH